MPDRRSPTAAELVEQKFEALASAAADRAAKLALEASEKATALAVERAVKDALVDRTLHEHQSHLEVINGSQARMATALEQVKTGQDKLVTAHEKQLAVTSALAEQAAEAGQRRWNRWEKAAGVLAVLASYGGIIVAVLAQ